MTSRRPFSYGLFLSKTTESTTTVPEANVVPETIELKKGVAIPIYLDGVDAENASQRLSSILKAFEPTWNSGGLDWLNAILGFTGTTEATWKYTLAPNQWVLLLTFDKPRGANCLWVNRTVESIVRCLEGTSSLASSSARVSVQPEDINGKVDEQIADEEPRSVDKKEKRSSRISRLYSKIFSEDAGKHTPLDKTDNSATLKATLKATMLEKAKANTQEFFWNLRHATVVERDDGLTFVLKLKEKPHAKDRERRRNWELTCKEWKHMDDDLVYKVERDNILKPILSSERMHELFNRVPEPPPPPPAPEEPTVKGQIRIGF
ncbi:hypothetical protein BDV19DRAFT_386541 [Aspergillus venezuelensis]